MFDRLNILIGEDNLKKLKNINIALIGVGGVGGFVLEALVRSGIHNITIVDGDIVSKSNLNRQIISEEQYIGAHKVDIAKMRAENINHDININTYKEYINEENIAEFFKNIDYIIDACDDVPAKISLIKYANMNDIPIICALGTGFRLDPGRVVQTTLEKTKNDPLAKKMRYLLKQNNISLKIPVVYSESLPLNKGSAIGSSIFVPGTAGLLMAYYVINDILKNN